MRTATAPYDFLAGMLGVEQVKKELKIELAYFNDVEQEKVDSLATPFAETRRQQIDRYLHEQNDSTRVRIIEPDPRSPKNVGSLPRFEMKYSMKGTEEE